MNYHELAKKFLKEIDEQAILVELEDHPEYYIFTSNYPGADLIIGDNGPYLSTNRKDRFFLFLPPTIYLQPRRSI
ncbi:MAG: hypothetical protein R3B93_15870 [Bacteroidia bacterium]